MFCAISSICLIGVGLSDSACAIEGGAAAAMNAKDPMTLDSIGESASYRPSPHLYGVEVGRATVQRPHRAATQHERHSLLSHERSLQFVKVSLQRSDDRSDVVPVGPTRLRTTDFRNRHANIARPILAPKPKRLDFCIERRLSMAANSGLVRPPSCNFRADSAQTPRSVRSVPLLALLASPAGSLSSSRVRRHGTRATGSSFANHWTPWRRPAWLQREQQESQNLPGSNRGVLLAGPILQAATLRNACGGISSSAARIAGTVRAKSSRRLLLARTTRIATGSASWFC